MSSTLINAADLQKEALQLYLRNSLSGEWPLPSTTKDLLGSLGELLTLTPLVYVALLHKALVAVKAKPEEVQVLSGAGAYGEVLTVVAGVTPIAEVRFHMVFEGDFLLNSHIRLTREAIDLIESDKETITNTDAARHSI